jgi:hypothetical protein
MPQEDILLKEYPKSAFLEQMMAQLTTFLQEPEQVAYFQQHPDQLAELTSNPAAAVDDMYHVLHDEAINNRVGRDEGTQIVWIGPDVDPVARVLAKRSATAAAGAPSAACIAALVTCAVDVLTLAFQILGAVTIARNLARTLAAGLEPAGLIGLEVSVNAVVQAASKWDKAVAIARLAGQIFKQLGLKQILQALKDNLRWYQWILMGVIMAAQLVAWFASDGIALAAEIVIAVVLVGVLVADIVAAVGKCGWAASQAVPAPA